MTALVNATGPDTGQPWYTSNTNVTRAGAIRRGGKAMVFARDYFGQSTSLSPSNFTPFSVDNNIRQDLGAYVLNPDVPGVIIPNVTPNQGWYPIGFIDEKAIDVSPDLSVDKLMAAQTIVTLRSDKQKKGKTVGFRALESTAVTDYLEYDLPFSEMQDDGSAGYGIGEQVDDWMQQRQLLIIRCDARNGLLEYTVQAFGCVVIDKLNKRTVGSKKDADALDIVFDVLVDPYMVDLKGRPITDYKWRGGPGWLSAGGDPAWGVVAPVAAAVSGAKATVTVAEPSDVDPLTVTYSVSQQVGGSGSYTASTTSVGSPAGVGTGTLVFTVTGLTATSTYIFKVAATGSDQSVATSVVSNSITATS